MPAAIMPQSTFDTTISSTQSRSSQRGRQRLSDIIGLNFATKAERRQSLKSIVIASPPISPNTALRSPRPKLQRRHASDELPIESKAGAEPHREKEALPLVNTTTTSATSFDNNLDHKAFDSATLPSQPAQDKSIPDTTRSPATLSSPIKITVCAIEFDREEDGEESTSSGINHTSADEIGVSYVEYVEHHDIEITHAIDASPSADYTTSVNDAYNAPPTFFPRHLRRSGESCDHVYHSLDCISETASAVSSPIFERSALSPAMLTYQPSLSLPSYASIPMTSPLSAGSCSPSFAHLATTFTTSTEKDDYAIERDNQCHNSTLVASIPRLTLTPPDEEVAGCSAMQVEYDDYDYEEDYVRARGHGGRGRWPVVTDSRPQIPS